MRAFVLVLVAGCSAAGDKGVGVDGGASGDAASTPCTVTLSFNPSPAHSGATIRAAAIVMGALGIPTYVWHVKFNNVEVTTTQAATDNSQIDFFATNAGPYDVSVDLGFVSGCDPASTTLNVGAPNANVADYRIHVVPPFGVAPPQDTIVEVDGGADANRPIALDPGLTPSLQVTDGTTGQPAYVRFESTTSPAAFVDAFTALDGQLQPRLLGAPYTAVVVPATAGLAPTSIAWQPGMTDLTVLPGTVVTGTVKDPVGVALAGATVQLTSAGLPSTIATTASDGSFSVRETFGSGAQVTVDVTAPAARGLPRLSATSAFDLMQPLQIRYAAALATCDLSGTAVVRSSTNQPGAVVTAVGTIASAGTVTATTAVAATGSVRIAVTADGTGHLPSTLVPKASLSAVVQLGAGDYTVAALDRTSCTATAITAPANVAAAGTVTGSTATVLSGALVEATPTRALALAGVPAIQVTTNTSGHFSIALAAGGYYDLRFSDPLGRAAPNNTNTDTSSASVPASIPLGAALHLTGTVSVLGTSNPVAGTSLQVLCVTGPTCTGIERLRPIADAATDGASMFRLAVPDPGIGM